MIVSEFELGFTSQIISPPPPNNQLNVSKVFTQKATGHMGSRQDIEHGAMSAINDTKVALKG